MEGRDERKVIEMALRSLSLRREIDRKTKELEALRAKDADFDSRNAELEKAIEEVNTDEEQETDLLQICEVFRG